MDLIINDEIIEDALNYFRSKRLEIEYIEEEREYRIFDFFTDALYTEEELILQYLRETKRRYNGKTYW